MEPLYLVVALAIVVILLGFKLLNVSRRLGDTTANNSVEMVKTDVVELTRSVTALQQTMSDRLERSHSTMQLSMQRQLSESAKLVAQVSERLTKLDETNRRVVDVAQDLKTLQNVLQNPKQRGVFGEYYLQTVLENILPPKHFQMQYKFSDGQIADAVIMLEKGLLLPIDSKFSLENYNRMLSEPSSAEREKWLSRVRMDLKGRIDETSKYIRPQERTMDFAFMFIPSEALYYDLLVGTVGTGTSARDLIEYAFRDKKVIIVSPTSLMAYLQTVLQGLRSLQIEQQAKDIQIQVGKLGRHIAAFEDYMQRLGVSLGTTVGHFNAAHKELGKMDKDVVKIASTDKSIEPLLLDRPGIDSE